MDFIAKTRIEHNSLIITIPSEIVEALGLDRRHGKNNFLRVNVRKLERIIPQKCFMRDCDEIACVVIQDKYGVLTPYCLKHYKFIRRECRRKRR